MSATTRPGHAPPLRHRVHKGRREAPGVDPRVDTLLGMVMALTSEVSILRDRLDAHERLNAGKQPVTPEAVDDFVPDEAAQKARAALRTRLIEKVCRPLLAADNAAAEDEGEEDEDGKALKGHAA
jgi:hypothetical protein